MSADTRSRLKQWLESGEAKLYPATLPQLELWESAPVPAGDGCNNICTVTKIRGSVSKDFCERAMAMVVEKQEVLRLSILPGKNGPVQLIRKSRRPALNFRLVEGDQLGDEEVDELIDGLIRKPFDLVAGPLYRVEVIRRSADEHILVLVIHHAIADGWTLGVFMTDLWTAYALHVLGASGGLEPVNQSYTDWGQAERAFWTPQEIRKRGKFWVEQMDGAERMWDAPPKEEDPGRRGRWMVELPLEQFTAMKELAGQNGATKFSGLLSAFLVVLSIEANKEDVLVGSPVANRGKKAVWDTMGSFAGIVPLRNRINRDETFVELLDRTHQMTVDSFANALPFTELVKSLDEKVVPGRNPVFDVRFALQNHPVPDVSMPGLEVEYRTRSTGTSRFDLACELTETGGSMEVVWLYREDIFLPQDIERIHQKYSKLLSEVCENPGATVAELIERIS